MLRFTIASKTNFDIEDLRVTILSHIISKQLDDDILIKIDNKDQEKEILELLTLFNIDFSRVLLGDENIKYHTQMAMKLLLDKKAFNCFCSKEALENDKKLAKKENKPYSYSGFCETISDEAKFNCNAPFVVRLKKPQNNISFTNSLHGELEYEPFEVDSCVILNHDKSPSSNFSCAVDDMLYDISTVIEKQSDILDIPKQIHIRSSLGYDKKINYITLPKIENVVSVKDLIDEGYLPAAIANYIISLGYNTPKKIFTIEEAIKWFDIANISKEPISFEIEKLKLINTKYLQDIDELRLSKILGYADNDIGSLAKLYLEECSTIKQLKEKIDMIFSKKESSQEFKILQECLKKAPYIENFKDFENYLIENTKLSKQQIETPLRLLLTKEKSGPELSEIYPLIKNYLGEIV